MVIISLKWRWGGGGGQTLKVFIEAIIVNFIWVPPEYFKITPLSEFVFQHSSDFTPTPKLSTLKVLDQFNVLLKTHKKLDSLIDTDQYTYIHWLSKFKSDSNLMWSWSFHCAALGWPWCGSDSSDFQWCPLPSWPMFLYCREPCAHTKSPYHQGCKELKMSCNCCF